MMLQAVDDDEKGVNIAYTLGGNQEAWFLTEYGVYEVLMQSRKPIAKQFKKEVKAVLKSIRKYGIYMTSETLEQAILNPDTVIQLVETLKQEKEEKEQLKTENLKQRQLIKSKKLVTITQIAKDYGMSGIEMNKLLHTLNVQYKQGGQWLLYKKYHDKGYVHSETFCFEYSNGKKDSKMLTKWTQKGRLFLYDLLKQQEILPLIEQEETIL